MRSRAMRLVLSVAALLAISAAAVFTIYTERQVTDRRTAFRAFDQHAHEAADAIASMRQAQQAYVAAGQGVAYWIPEVAGFVATASAVVAQLRQTVTDVDAGSSLNGA